MNILNILQQIKYKFHILLNCKNKNLLTLMLQITFVLLLANLYDYTYCMTNESDNGSEISSIFDYDEDYIEHSSAPLVEHLTDLYERQFWENANVENMIPVETQLGPMFDYLTHQNEEHIEHIPDFDEQPLSVKIKALQNAYFTESIEKAVIQDALNKQTDQLFRRQESLIEAKETIKDLTQENLELKQYIAQIENELSNLSQRK